MARGDPNFIFSATIIVDPSNAIVRDDGSQIFAEPTSRLWACQAQKICSLIILWLCLALTIGPESERL